MSGRRRLCGRNAVQISREFAGRSTASRRRWHPPATSGERHLVRARSATSKFLFPDGRAIIKGTSDRVARSLAKYVRMNSPHSPSVFSAPLNFPFGLYWIPCRGTTGIVINTLEFRPNGGRARCRSRRRVAPSARRSSPCAFGLQRFGAGRYH